MTNTDNPQSSEKPGQDNRSKSSDKSKQTETAQDESADQEQDTSKSMAVEELEVMSEQEGALSSKRWELPSFDSGQSPGTRSQQNKGVPKPPTAQEIAAIRQAAFDEGKQDGYESGLQQAQAELTKMKQEFDALMHQMEKPFEREQEKITEELAELASMVTRQIIRREVKQNPDQIIAVIREAIKLLPSSGRQVTVKMHPEDANLIRKIFSVDGERQSGWTITDDPSISRGGCSVSTDVSNIDATIEKRIADIFTHVFGDQRVAKDDPQA